MKEIALVLGGGGARGLAHVHVFQAFDDLGLRPAVIAGSSIGAIMGAGYAAGMTAGEIRDHAVATFGNRSQVLSRLWRLRPDDFRSFIRNAPRLGELNAQRILQAFLPDRLPDSFEELQIPLKVTATDFYGNSLTVIETGPLLPGIAASAAIPAIFRPEIVAGRFHVDGGIANPVPFDLVAGPDRIVVAVDVIGSPQGDVTKMPSRMEAAFGASQLMMQSILNLKLKLHSPDLLVRPPVSEYRVLDFLHAEAIIERTAPVREEVRAGLEKLLQSEQLAG